MRSFALPLMSVLMPLIVLSQAAPVSTASSPASVLLPRSQLCYGSTTKAGTRFEPRDLNLPESAPPITRLIARTPPRMFFCTPGTTTYVAVDFAYRLPDHLSTLHLIIDAHRDVLDWVSQHGDGVLPQGYFTYHELGLELYYENANNHQLTWGVVGSASFALWNYVNWLASTWAAVGAITFAVFDGPNQVGTGYVQLQ